MDSTPLSLSFSNVPFHPAPRSTAQKNTVVPPLLWLIVGQLLLLPSMSMPNTDSVPTPMTPFSVGQCPTVKKNAEYGFHVLFRLLSWARSVPDTSPSYPIPTAKMHVIYILYVLCTDFRSLVVMMPFVFFRLYDGLLKKNKSTAGGGPFRFFFQLQKNPVIGVFYLASPPRPNAFRRETLYRVTIGSLLDHQMPNNLFRTLLCIHPLHETASFQTTFHRTYAPCQRL